MVNNILLNIASSWCTVKAPKAHKDTRPVPKAYTFRTGRVPYLRVRSLDVEAQRAHHIAAVLSNTLRAPRRHPNPVHTPRINQVIQVALNLLLNNLLQRARRSGQSQVQNEGSILIPAQTVEQTEVNNIDAELRVNDLLEGCLLYTSPSPRDS